MELMGGVWISIEGKCEANESPKRKIIVLETFVRRRERNFLRSTYINGFG